MNEDAMNIGQNAIGLLANRTWRDLRATARMHNFHFNNRWTHAEALAALCHFLIGQDQLKKILHRLNNDELAALMTLKTHDGCIKYATFTQTFGEMRRYRPWRDNAPPHPWRRPVSTTEKLWFLGLIEVQHHQAVFLPDSVATLLPDVPHPETVIWAGDVPDFDAAAVVRDIAAFLGTLLHTPVHLLHDRWLPPYSLHAINRRLSVPEQLDGIRSEFAVGRIRFLHYLALAAELVSVQNSVLLPTAEAWNWLGLPYVEAHACLLTAIRTDLHTRQPLWDRFKFPAVGAGVWDALTELPPGAYSITSVAEAVRLRVLAPFTITTIRALLRGPLSWLGVGTIDQSQILLMRPTFGETGHAALHICPDSIGITLPALPDLSSLVNGERN
jgi:hypothetical protein